MQKLIRTALDNRNRIAAAALVTTSAALTTLGSAQTAQGLDGGALATGASNAAQGLMGQGGPAVFGLVGIATGAIWLLNRVRSLG